MQDSKVFIHRLSKAVDDAVDEALIEQVIPQLRTLIDKAAESVLANPGFEQSPFAKEFAAEMIIKGLAGLLALSSFDDTETARPVMLEPKYVNWWFGYEDEDETGE